MQQRRASAPGMASPVPTDRRERVKGIVSQGIAPEEIKNVLQPVKGRRLFTVVPDSKPGCYSIRGGRRSGPNRTWLLQPQPATVQLGKACAPYQPSTNFLLDEKLFLTMPLGVVARIVTSPCSQKPISPLLSPACHYRTAASTLRAWPWVDARTAHGRQGMLGTVREREHRDDLWHVFLPRHRCIRVCCKGFRRRELERRHPSRHETLCCGGRRDLRSPAH